MTAAVTVPGVSTQLLKWDTHGLIRCRYMQGMDSATALHREKAGQVLKASGA